MDDLEESLENIGHGNSDEQLREEIAHEAKLVRMRLLIDEKEKRIEDLERLLEDNRITNETKLLELMNDIDDLRIRENSLCKQISDLRDEHHNAIETIASKEEQIHGLTMETRELKSRISSFSPAAQSTRYGHEASGNVTVIEKNTKKPTSFDGTRSWSEYLVHFETISKLNGWSDAEKALELSTILQGDALTTLAELSEEERSNFRILSRRLSERFEPENQERVYKSQLQSRRRKNKESLPELGQDIKRLVHKAWRNTDHRTKTIIAKDHFLDAISEDTDLWYEVERGKPETIDDAIALGLECETLLERKRKSRFHVRFTKTDQPEQGKDLTQLVKVVETLQQDIQGLKKGNRPHGERASGERQGAYARPRSDNGVICYNCERRGHMAKDCPDQRRQQHRRWQGNNAANHPSGNWN